MCQIAAPIVCTDHYLFEERKKVQYLKFQNTLNKHSREYFGAKYCNMSFSGSELLLSSLLCMFACLVCLNTVFSVYQLGANNHNVRDIITVTSPLMTLQSYKCIQTILQNTNLF